MKKRLCQLLCFSAFLLAAEEQSWFYDLNSKAIRAAVKDKEAYASVSDAVLTIQSAPGRKYPWSWRTIALPLDFITRKQGKEFSFRISGELKLLDVERGKKSEGVILLLRFFQDGKPLWRFFSGFPRYGTTEWLPFSGVFELPENAEKPELLCGLSKVSGTFGIRNLIITEME